MKNYVSDGNALTVTAPAAVSAGAGVLIGSIFGVAANAMPVHKIISPTIHWRIVRLLQEPSNVIREEQQQRDHNGGDPEPTPAAAQYTRVNASSVRAAA